MKLTVAQIFDLFQGLSALDNDSIKLAAAVRLKVAINLNRLKPLAAGYERATAIARAAIVKANRELAEKDRRSDAEIAADYRIEADRLGTSEEDVDLKTFIKSDLRLDDNPKIGPVVIAQCLPVLDDADTL